MAVVTIAEPGLGRRAWTFVRHFLEMCVSMCAPGAVLYFLVFTTLPALAGTGDLRQQAPEVSLVIIAVQLAAPMTAWMLFRGMPWRPTLEMAAVPPATAFVFIGLTSLGVLADSALQIRFGQFCGVTCIAMLGVMLARLDVYTGHVVHHPSHMPTRG